MITPEIKSVKKLICKSCNTHEAIGVFAIPGCPMSEAYCQDCIEHDSHPMYAIIANTACCGGFDKTSEWWQGLVMHSLEYQHKTLEWFNVAVAQSIAEMDAYFEQQEEMTI